MTHYRVQEWPDMPGDGEDGDGIIFSTDSRGHAGEHYRAAPASTAHSRPPEPTLSHARRAREQQAWDTASAPTLAA